MTATGRLLRGSKHTQQGDIIESRDADGSKKLPDQAGSEMARSGGTKRSFAACLWTCVWSGFRTMEIGLFGSDWSAAVGIGRRFHDDD